MFIKSKIDPNVYIKQAHAFFSPLGVWVHTQRNQWDYFTKGLWIFFRHFSLFHMKEFLNELFFSMLLKIHSCPNRSQVLCQTLLKKYQFFKVCKFCQILRFILKIYHNFESYQNMLTTLGFFFLYHKLQLCFVCHAHYNPFICGKGLLKIWKILWISKNFKFHVF